MIRIVLILMSIVTLLACESSKKVDEQCDEGGTLEGTKWCDGTSLTKDYKVLGDISKKKANCAPGQPANFTATEKETILKNVVPLSSPV